MITPCLVRLRSYRHVSLNARLEYLEFVGRLRIWFVFLYTYTPLMQIKTFRKCLNCRGEFTKILLKFLLLLSDITKEVEGLDLKIFPTFLSLMQKFSGSTNFTYFIADA